MPPANGIKSQRQPVHSDADSLHPSHPFALVVNVGLISMEPETGSTEVWLGTQNGECGRSRRSARRSSFREDQGRLTGCEESSDAASAANDPQREVLLYEI